MSNINENINKWIKFLDPENLKDNLMFSSLFIASFESLKDFIIDEVKFFYNDGILDGEFTFSDDYNTKVKSLNASIVKSSLLWLKKNDAVNDNDITIFDELRDYRNKLSHELMTLLFEGLPEELPKKFAQLVELRIKIEKWWIINVEIPTNPDFDDNPEIKEEEIMTSSQIFNQIIFDMLSGDEKRASYYHNEFKQRFNK